MSSAREDLRILLVVDSLDHGGAEAQVVGLSSALARLGHRPEIACSVEGALASAARAEGIQVHPLMSHLVKRTASVGYGRVLRSFVRACGPFDVVHAHMYASLVAAGYATQGSGTPLVSTEHSEAKWRGGVARMLCRRSFRAATAVIAVSEGIRARLVEQDHVDPQKVVVIPNAVRRRFDGGAPAVHPALAGAPLVGVVARLHPDKGVGHLIEAAPLISERLPEARFVVVGEGPELTGLRQLARQLDVADRITFLGYRPDAWEILQTMDVVVVPSISEGTPLVVLEAMQSGIPLVASAAGGIPEQIVHGREGLLVPPGDPRAIADAVVRLHESPALAAALTAAARRRAAAYDHSAMVTRTEAVYLAAARRGRSVTSRQDVAGPDPRLRPDLGVEAKTR